MTVNYSAVIKEILRFKETFGKLDPSTKNSQKLVGELGEYYVLRELEKRGFSPTHKGGQGRYDILLQNGKKIEVKTSVPKNEGVYPKDVEFWGWTVERKTARKNAQNFDYLVGVALNKQFKNPKYYIFSYAEASLVGEVNIGRFGNINKKINLFLAKEMFQEAVRSRPQLVTPHERIINRYPERFLDKWNKLK